MGDKNNQQVNRTTPLLPCPFCGTGNELPEWDLDEDSSRENLPGWLQVTGSHEFSVECFGCGVETRLFDTVIEAIEAWNTRTAIATILSPPKSIVPTEETKRLRASDFRSRSDDG